MEYKVRVVDGIEPKGVQEVEGQLLDKHEEEINPQVDPQGGEVNPQVDESKSLELNEESVLSFIKNKYGKQINSVEELWAEREQSQEIPEDVAAYMKYKKDTGRGFSDFSKLNRDIDAENPDKLLRDYLTATEKGLDADDIESMMEDYSFDEDLDDETSVRKIKLQKKKAIAKAKDYFESEKEKYSIPLESRGNTISEEESKELEEYKQYVQKSSTNEEEVKRKTDWFAKKTDEVFGSEFKGFEFTLDGNNKVFFNPGDLAEVKGRHQNPSTFIQKFLDDDGLLKDAVGYHKSLAMAMNPEKFASFFYEQGKSNATEGVVRGIKNINMTTRNAPEVTSKGGMQIREVNPDNGKGLRIKSKK
tara:strand:- start:273 stop:1355 length:1083 start_codon:yes stop_codon:yes gene_type:complete